MHKVSTNVRKVNFKFILNNVTNKEFWETKWRIFDYGHVTLLLSLDEINITHNYIYLMLKAIYNDERVVYTNSTYVRIPLSDSHYNSEVFQKRLLSRAHDVVRQVEIDLLRATDGYAQAYERRTDLQEAQLQEMNDFLDAEGIENEEVRNSYIAQNKKTFSEETTDAYIYENVGNVLASVHNMLDVSIEFE